ncbi:MAG TPA: hypothetical protein VM077_00550 [Candidatus Limnocylindrales bacterium]|nr:hypothetical protein [Candidatus Limnocylindrales bacterium]
MAPEYEIGFEYRRKPDGKASERLRVVISSGIGEPQEVAILDARTITLRFIADSLDGAQDQASVIYRSGELPVDEGYVLQGLSVKDLSSDGPKFEYPPRLSVSAPRIKMLDMFAQILRPGKKVYYPGPNIDASPSMVPGFENSEIIYLDTQENNVRALKQGGAKAYQGRAEEFDPGEIDVLLFLGFYRKEVLRFVRPGGYAVLDISMPPKSEIEDFDLVATAGIDRDNMPFLARNSGDQFKEGDRGPGMFILRRA